MLKLFCKVVAFVVLFAAVAPRLHACSRPPGYGFVVLSSLLDNTQPFPVFQNIAQQALVFDFVQNDVPNPGATATFAFATDNSGVISALGKASPAIWNVTYIDKECSNQDPFAVPPFNFNKDFQANSSPQRIICERNFAFQGISASPSSFDTSVGPMQYTMNMTDTSGAWQRNPATWVNYDSVGDVMQQGSIDGVQDAYDCWAYFTPYFDNNRGSAIQYVWLADVDGNGIGYATISVTNGTSGGG